MNNDHSDADPRAPRAALVRSLARVVLALAGARAARRRSDVDAIWNDPVFKKQFVGGYGINAEIEPRVTPDEVEILEKVRPLMADDLPKAEDDAAASR